MFPYVSFAVTVTEPAVPAVAGLVKPETTKLVALAGLIVNWFVAEVKPEDAPVNVGVAATVSL